MQQLWRKLWYWGLSRYCPVCNSRVRRFGPYGLAHRPDALCPICQSLERHRLVWSFFKERTDLFTSKARKMLHFAPEPQFTRQLKAIPGLEYLSADLFDPRAMRKMDITRIDEPDESFDLIYCSHVLEHIDDDRKAIGELYRVLKTGGQAVIVVPVTAEKTFEDPSVTDPQTREELFGQHDHVRRYGIDVVDRLRDSGFSVTTVYASDLIPPKSIQTMGLGHLDERQTPIFCCRKD